MAEVAEQCHCGAALRIDGETKVSTAMRYLLAWRANHRCPDQKTEVDGRDVAGAADTSISYHPEDSSLGFRGPR